MNNKQASDKMITLSQELQDTHPYASLIIGVVGCITGEFEQEALMPLAGEAHSFGEMALSVMKQEEE